MKDRIIAGIIFGILLIFILIFSFSSNGTPNLGEGCKSLGDNIYDCKLGQNFEGFMTATKLQGDVLFYISWEDSDVGGYSLYERVKEGEIFETGEVKPGIKYVIEVIEVNNKNIKISTLKVNYPGKCEVLTTWQYKCSEGQSTTSGSIVVEEIGEDFVKLRAHPLQFEEEFSSPLKVDSLWVLNPRNSPSYPQNYIKISKIESNEYVIFDTFNFNPNEGDFS